jgi:hypothetical protein
MGKQYFGRSPWTFYPFGFKIVCGPFQKLQYGPVTVGSD